MKMSYTNNDLRKMNNNRLVNLFRVGFNLLVTDEGNSHVFSLVKNVTGILKARGVI